MSSMAEALSETRELWLCQRRQWRNASAAIEKLTCDCRGPCTGHVFAALRGSGPLNRDAHCSDMKSDLAAGNRRRSDALKRYMSNTNAPLYSKLMRTMMAMFNHAQWLVGFSCGRVGIGIQSAVPRSRDHAVALENQSSYFDNNKLHRFFASHERTDELCLDMRSDRYVLISSGAAKDSWSQIAASVLAYDCPSETTGMLPHNLPYDS
jgi:hypothetical protein